LIVCDPDYVTTFGQYYPQEENSLDDLLGDVGLDQFEGLDESRKMN
jgi:hypothetical protein